MGAQVKNFGSPDETRKFADGKGQVEVVKLEGGGTVGRVTFEPGFRWSEHVKPIVGTESCQVAHLGYVISGRMHIRMDDGSENEVGPGDVMALAPGHVAWVVGDEPSVQLDFQGAAHYAEPPR
jgi:quercetin dioxygenase-like cupin family protein